MTFKTLRISGFHVFAYKFFLMPTTSLKRTVKPRGVLMEIERMSVVTTRPNGRTVKSP